MKWSELPQEYKDLKLLESDRKLGYDFSSDNLGLKFNWGSTKQGDQFWIQCHEAKSIDDLPPITNTYNEGWEDKGVKEEPFYITYVEGSVPCHVKYSLDEAVKSVEEIVIGTDSKVYILKAVQVYQREIKIKQSLI
jgi:hypothetical protein